MIYQKICPACYKSNFGKGKILIKFLEFFSKIYKYSLIISAIFGFLVVLIFPTYLRPFSITIMVVSILIITVLGTPIFLLPSFQTTLLQENLDFSRDNQTIMGEYIENCTNHPNNHAIARCSICLQPYCSQDFCFDGKIPKYCLNCLDNIFKIKLGTMSQAWMSLGLLSALGIFIEIINSFRFAKITFYFASLIIVILIPLMVYLIKKMIISENKNRRRSRSSLPLRPVFEILLLIFAWLGILVLGVYSVWFFSIFGI